MLSWRYVSVLVLAALFPLSLASQPSSQELSYRISYLTSDDGLSQNTVDCILKDSRGFMWFGTWNGLNRYDGYSFKVYKREDKANSLSDNFIHSLSEDRRGNLWIGTRNGLNLFDFKSDRFTRFLADTTKPGNLSGNWINIVHCSPDGIVWAGTNGQGLNKIIPKKGGAGYEILQIRQNSRGSLRLGDDFVNHVITDRFGRLWVGTNDGLTLFDPAKDTSYIFRTDAADPSSLTSNEILSLFEDKDGDIWVGTRFGLNRWNGEQASFARYFNTINDPGSISHAIVYDIGQDPNGRIYIATLGGLDIYNPANDNFDHVPNDGLTNLSLNTEFINSIYCDYSGLVWVGTEKGGVNKFNIQQKQFRAFSEEGPDKMKLNENTVNSILPEGRILWIGTAGGGLNRIDFKNRQVRYYTFDAQRENSIGSNYITSLLRDRQGILWIGSWGGGFSKLISENADGQFLNYQNDPDPGSLVNSFVSGLVENPDGKIWVGTEGGLDLFDPKGNTFLHVLDNPVSGTPLTDVGCLLLDASGNLWVGTRKGLYLITAEDIAGISYNPNTIKPFWFRNDSKDQASLNENYIISLYQDSKGTLWIGTYGDGLNKLVWNGKDPSTVKFIHYNQEDGLSNNVVYGILEDEVHQLWLSTDYGLSKFDPENEEFNNYFVSDGLQSNQFYWSASAKGSDGTLYFGSMNGVNYFRADQIVNNQVAPRPTLTELKIYNHTIEPGRGFEDRIILDQSISETREIELTYRENTFSLEFSGLSYQLPGKNKYAYKLEGIDQDWVVVGSNRRFASYTKLPGGEYLFYLKAANNDGLWNSEPLRIKIVIRPPFWKTTWFKIMVVLVLLALVALYFQRHTRNLKMQKRKLEQQVTERTRQIEDQKIKLEHQNSEILEQRDRLIHLNRKVKAVNQQKLRFFTNISHEFRTPLTLILGPLEKLKKMWDEDGESKQLLNLISRNTERLLHLVNQLMDFRKIEKGKMTLHVQEGNPFLFISNILDAFKDPVFHKSISLELQCARKDARVWFDHEKLENVLYNLLSNALKYTLEKGMIKVSVKFSADLTEEDYRKKAVKTESPFMRIEVEDNGIGISKDKLPNIFKRFYQAEQPNESASGTGIGLSLTKDLVKICKGHIAVESEQGKRTSFIFDMPCEREAYSDNEITLTKPGDSNLKMHVEMLRNMLEAEHEKSMNIESPQLIRKEGRTEILIVEDNRELREFVASKLNNSYNILLATNGEEALELAEAAGPDLIISDIMMPVMDGLKLCTILKQKVETSHIPIILLTAKSTVENQMDGYRIGADDYIPKPFHMELLETRIENLIESRKKLHQIFSQERLFSPEELTENPTDQKFLQAALEQIEENLDNADFNVSDFASSLCISRSLLHKKLTALTDQSATDFINTVRLKKSRQFMMEGSYNISEVAYAVGYNDPKYFSRLFKRHFGISPSEYIKELRSKAG
ncbi:MAG: response regulator [Bacteroidales bacterium]|nr:response regulator [Bacteroidales bacterium]